MDILCLQETKVSTKQKIQLKNCNLHLSSKLKDYGLGFLVSKIWKDVCIKKVSDRLAILEGSIKGSSMKVPNCYEPTQVLCNKIKESYDELLQQLKKFIKTKDNQILLIQGDFNAKIGKNY